MQSFEEFGIAAFLPGMQYMIELMQQQLDSLRGQLASIQNGKNGNRATKPTRNRKKKVSSGWSDNPEERSIEMKRRQEVARQKRRSGKQSNAATTRWNRMTAAKRKEWQLKMQAGKTKAKRNKAKVAHIPAVRLAS